MNLLLALISASAHSLTSVAVRVYQTKIQKNMADFRLYQMMGALIAALANFAAIGFTLELDGMGIFLGICYGGALAFTGMLVAVCYSCGPMSVTSVISNACVALPIAVGCIWYDEVMTGPQIIGCVLLALTFVLSAVNPKEEKQSIQPKWYILVFLAFFCNGMGAVLLNIYGRVAGNAQQGSYLTLGYFVSALIYFVVYFVEIRKVEPAPIKSLISPLLIAVLLMTGIGGFIGNKLLLGLNTAMPASVLYPLVNGGIAVIVAAISCVVFREKLTIQRLLTILVGLAAIVALNL